MFEGFEIGIGDIAQIVILSVAIYTLIDYVRGTRAGQVLTGLIRFVVLPGFLIWIFKWDVLGRVFFWLIIALAVSMIVVFQEEIRRGLALMGGGRFFGVKNENRREFAPEILAKAVQYLAKARLGALIALERGISLAGYEESGVKVGACISRELLVSIFTPPLPLHDGGIIIRHGVISAAHCIFPVSNQADLISSGMRHRAAVGLSEETDAVVIVVSEERGTVSIAHNGQLHRYPPDIANKMLLRWIEKSIANQRKKEFRLAEWIVVRMTRFMRSFLSQRKRKEGDKHVA